jgi:hypothetical protein
MAILKVRGPNAKGEYKVFMSKVVRDGRVQKAFAEQIGHKTGACVRGAVHAGMTGPEIKDAVRKCGKANYGTKLSIHHSD